MYPRGTIHIYELEIGHGFTAKSRDYAHLEKHNLLGRGPLAFVNDLCALVDEKKDELPSDEWDSLEFTLHRLMLMYEDGELYEHLLHNYGPNALGYNAWVHFTIDPNWDVCLKAFIDMPTEILEEYGSRNSIPDRHTEDNKAIMDAISKRADTYGGNSLPRDMVEGILFNHYS
jgi:hypothetical protein